MDNNPYQPTPQFPATPPQPRGRTWRIAVGITLTLAVFLIADTGFCLLDRTIGPRRKGVIHRPIHWLAVQELLVGLSPRAAAIGLPVAVLFLRITGGLTVAALVGGTLVRLATSNRWRIRTSGLVGILIVSALCGAVLTGLLVARAARSGPDLQFFGRPPSRNEPLLIPDYERGSPNPRGMESSERVHQRRAARGA
jgi:hypothetical protein